MSAAELRVKDEKALNEELDGLRREQFNLRMQRGTGQLTRGHQLRVVRRKIARVLTILTEKSAARA